MLPLLLAVADVAHHAAESAEPSMVEKFGIEWHYIVWQIASFLILFGVVYKFLIKPTTAAMEARNAKIATGLKHAEETQVKLAAAQQESAAIIKQAQVDATRVIDEARKSAKDYLDKQTHEAAAKASDMLQKAQQAIELEHKQMLANARTEIARLVVVTTERVLAKKLTDADRAAYNETAARELTQV